MQIAFIIGIACFSLIAGSFVSFLFFKNIYLALLEQIKEHDRKMIDIFFDSISAHDKMTKEEKQLILDKVLIGMYRNIVDIKVKNDKSFGIINK